MTDEEIKKLATIYNKGLEHIEKIKEDFNNKYENMSKDEFVEEMGKDHEKVRENIIKNNVKVKVIKGDK